VENVQKTAPPEATSQTSRRGGLRTPAPSRPGSLDAGQAEATLVEHYPRLVRLAYLVLPSSLARHRRVVTAHALVQRALPRGSRASDAAGQPLPAQRHGAAQGEAYAYLSAMVLRAALAGERPLRIGPLKLPSLPPRPALLPRVYGLRLFPRSGGADELALDQALSEISAAGRAAYTLRGLEGMPDAAVVRTLTEAGARDAAAALAEADAVRGPAGSRDGSLLDSPEFDPCWLQARPTDLMRRRQHGRAALAALAAVLVCGGLLGLPGGAWGPDGAAAPPYARNLSAEKALDPGELTRVSPGAWKQMSRTDFSSWPARGDLTDDRRLLRRALAVWARPGARVTVSATSGTPAGPPVGPPQLLYAGRVDGASVVLLYDGLRVARYAEAEGAEDGGAILDLARTDGADTASSGALVVSRRDSNVRYLTAPWVTDAAEADLLRPQDRSRSLGREADGVLTSVTGPGANARECEHWPGLLLKTRTASGRSVSHLYTDLGELTAVRLTGGSPGGTPRDASDSAVRAGLAHMACAMRSLVGRGVRSVNSWDFGQQLLPEGDGMATWSCLRGETWRGSGARVIGGFQPPAVKPGEPAVVTARAVDSPACGPKEPHMVSGVLWESPAGNPYVLAAGSRQVIGIQARSQHGPEGESAGRTLMLPAKDAKGTGNDGSAKTQMKADLSARLTNGRTLHEPR
jgi:hypothetical protein